MRPSLANLGVSAFLLTVLLAAGGLIPGWIAIAQSTSDVSKPMCTDMPKSFCASLSSTFEVASVKRSKRLSTYRDFMSIRNSPKQGTVYLMGFSTLDLIKIAYWAPPYPAQVLGGPTWVRSREYQWDVQAKADRATDEELLKLSPDQARILKAHMIQALLADRFKLKVHLETRQLDSYALVVGRKGPKFQQAKQISSPSAGGAASAGAKKESFSVRSQNGQEVMSGAMTMAYLAGFLSARLRRRVIDETGLTGRYDLNLHWSPRLGAEPPLGAPSLNGGDVPASGAPSGLEPSGPSIYTALQEQLGLKLKPGKGPVQVLVVDQIEPPTAN